MSELSFEELFARRVQYGGDVDAAAYVRCLLGRAYEEVSSTWRGTDDPALYRAHREKAEPHIARKVLELLPSVPCEHSIHRPETKKLLARALLNGWQWSTSREDEEQFANALFQQPLVDTKFLEVLEETFAHESRFSPPDFVGKIARLLAANGIGRVPDVHKKKLLEVLGAALLSRLGVLQVIMIGASVSASSRNAA